MDPPHRLGFYNIKSGSTGVHWTGVHWSLTLYWDPSSKRGVHAKSLVSKTARTFGTPQGHFLSLPQPLSQAHVLNMCFLVSSWWHVWSGRVVLARTCNLSVPLPMMAFATRCWLHVVTRANRCDQKLILPIPVPKVSCHLANKMSAKVWRTSCLDQYDTTCCGHVLAMKIQHCYRGVDSVDSRWTRGGLSSDAPPNSETIW